MPVPILSRLAALKSKLVIPENECFILSKFDVVDFCTPEIHLIKKL